VTIPPTALPETSEVMAITDFGSALVLLMGLQ
jgi:hypothetical protein